MNGNLCLQQFELSSYVSTLSGLSLANKHLLMTSRGINAGYLSESNREDECQKKMIVKMYLKENSAAAISLSWIS